MKKANEYAAQLPGPFNVMYNHELLNMIKQIQIDAAREGFEAGSKWDFDNECNYYKDFEQYFKEIQ